MLTRAFYISVMQIFSFYYEIKGLFNDSNTEIMNPKLKNTMCG